MDAFRITLAKESKLLTKEKHATTAKFLSFYHPLTLKIISF